MLARLPRPDRSLHGRLIASYVFVVLVTVLVVIGALSVLLPIEDIRQAEQRLLFVGRPAQQVLIDLNNRYGTVDEMRQWLNDYAEAGPDAAGIRLLVVAPSGTVTIDTDEELTLEGRPFQLPGLAVPSGPNQRPVPAPRGRFESSDRTVYRYVALPNTVQRPTRGNWIWLIVAQPDRSWLVVMREFAQRLGLAGLGALAVATVVATLMARSLYRPIARLTVASEAMARGQYDQQVPVEGPVELAALARSFNRMAGEVREARQTTRDFVANVSHELRTPLTSIHGFVEALQDGTVTDQTGRERSLAIIQGELGRLQRLVNGLLDLSRIESGQAEMSRLPVDLSSLLTQCAEIVGQRADEQHIQLRLKLPDECLIVIGDADRLEQVCMNLLDNALRYTPAGGQITMSLAAVGERVEISIADTGGGIPATALPYLFERFFTADPARAGNGSGLGLAIARELLLAHGGVITVQSTLGQGSTFTINLPLVARSPGLAQAFAAERQPVLSVPR